MTGGFGSTAEDEEEPTKATMDGPIQRHERERRAMRADARPSCVQPTHQVRRPHIKWD